MPPMPTSFVPLLPSTASTPSMPTIVAHSSAVKQRFDFKAEERKRAADNAMWNTVIKDIHILYQFLVVLHKQGQTVEVAKIVQMWGVSDGDALSAFIERIRHVSKAHGAEDKCSEHEWTSDELAKVCYNSW